MGFSPLRSVVLPKSAYFCKNSWCVITDDIRCPTSSPLDEMTPSTGDLRPPKYPRDEKKSALRRRDEAAVVIGDGRYPVDSPSCPVAEEAEEEEDKAGFDMSNSYISRSNSNDVGKKMSKYPGWTMYVEHGTIVP